MRCKCCDKMIQERMKMYMGKFVDFDNFCSQCASLACQVSSEYEMKLDSVRTKVNNYDINKISSVVKQSLNDFIENNC